MGNKYFGIFFGICLLTLVYGFDQVTQSRVNQLAEAKALSYPSPCSSGLNLTVQGRHRDSLSQSIDPGLQHQPSKKHKRFFATELDEFFY